MYQSPPNTWVTETGRKGILVETRLPCSACNSSDAVARYTTNTYCFSCNNYIPIKDNVEEDKEPEPITDPVFTEGELGPIEARGIAKDTAALYGVSCVLASDKDTPIKHIYPYYQGSQKIAQKIREVAVKKFYSEGNMNAAGLFGMQLFPPSNRPYILVTEGELDAMAAYQMTGGLWPCVSLPKGAAASKKDILNNMAYLTAFKCIVLCFDNDEPGQKAANEVAQLFPAGKCKVYHGLPQYKDACDYLKAGKGKEFTNLVYESPVYSPAGIKDLYDLHDDFLKRKLEVKQSNLSYPWKSLNHLTCGIRTGEFIVVTADTGVGKTSFLREIQNHLLNTSDVKIGVMYIEEIAADTYGLTMGLELNAPVHLPNVDVDPKELQQVRDKIGRNRVWVYEHFGSNDFEKILNNIRYFKQANGCDIIILDHISMLVSDQRYADERKALDAIATKLKMLTVELNISIIAIVHQNREGQIRGSACVEQQANLIIKLERDIIDDDATKRNETKVIVYKNRFTGRTGPACTLKYIEETNRMMEVL